MRFYFLFFTLLFFSIIYINAQDIPQVEKILKGVTISEITGDENSIWVATYGKGIYEYSIKENKWINYSTSNNKLEQDLFYCIAVSKDFVWAGSSNGLYIFDKRKKLWQTRRFGLGGELGNWIRALHFDEQLNLLWIGRFKYLSTFDLKKRRYTDHDLTIGNNAKTNSIKMIKSEDDKYVWFGTEVGMHRFDKSKSPEDRSSFEFWNNETLNYFNNEGDAVSVSDIIFEKNGIWFGLDEFITPDNPSYNIGGIYFFNNKSKWVRIDKFNGLPGNGIYTMFRTGNVIWTGIYEFSKSNKEQFGRGIALINRINFNVTPLPPSKIIPTKVFTIFFDSEFIWLGSDDGITKIKLTNDFISWE